MEYYNFKIKQDAIDFCILINEGEKIEVSEKNTTTGYAQPFELNNEFYVIADEITAKYTNLIPIKISITLQ